MPPPIVVTIKIPDRAAAMAKIEQIVAKAKDAPGLLASIGEAELPVVRERFASKTAPDGSAWAPNKPLTLMLSGGKGSMMRRSGALMGSINYVVSGGSLKLGPNKPYAAAQQFGAVITGKDGPLRIPVPGGTYMSKHQAQGIGVDLKVARGHRDGDGGRSKGDGAIYVMKVTIPPRQYIGIGRKDAEAITNALVDWFTAE